ncbi:hypothetical protein Drose_26990 [Dactylosporangium roseum]|uniref:Phthiocerol/phthiodiolone dimycocerosyl transferase n=1 Tax=Dactylosporangium roseum TaxID=47989 RepID=A0ABY5Z180_9ACTN|nr:hypothetical protein [Dactylosporangium roseum]UWZ34815.1 hypothetical protein Drose_26990 [Dactylosporangium roseum]
MTDGRVLDTVECQLANQPTALVVRYRGQLRRPALDLAFQRLAEANPLLRARLVSVDGLLSFHIDAEHPSPPVVGAGDHVSLLRQVAQTWSTGNALSRLVVSVEQDGGHVGMFTDHSIADGRAKFALLVELWAIYTALAEGGRAEPVAQVVPAPPTVVLAGRLGRAVPPLTQPSGRPGDGKVELRKRYTTFSADETAALTAFARAGGLTVNALLAGAILASQLRCAEQGPEPIEMTCVSRIDLRSRVDPPIGALETTNLSGVHAARVPVGLDTDPADIARTINQQLRASVGKRFPENDFLDRSFAEREHSGAAGLSTVALSNLGRLPDLPAPAGLSLEGFSIFSHSGAMAHPAYAVSTYRDQLSIQFLYDPRHFDDETMRVVIDDVTRFLRSPQRHRPAVHPLPAGGPR